MTATRDHQVNEVPRKAEGLVVGTLESALGYAERGFSVIPVHGIADGKCTCDDEECSRPGKHPLKKWQRYQREPADSDRVRAWFENHPERNIGIVTGGVSKIAVLDIDGPEGVASLKAAGIDLPETPTALTGGGGHHLIYRMQEGLKSATGVLKKIDIRAEGGFIVAPPSLHESGTNYAWAKSKGLDDLPIADFDFSILTNGKPEKVISIKGVAKGRRNDTTASYAGKLIRKGLSHDEVLALCLAQNEANARPQSKDDVTRTVQSIFGAEANKPDKFKQVEAVNLAFPPELFVGAAGEYAESFSEYLESPKEFLYFAYLTCLGNMISRQVSISSMLKPQARLFTLLLGQTAATRKSTAARLTIEFFQAADGAFSRCQGVGSAEGLQKQLSECGIHNGGLLLHYDEFKAFVSKCKVEGSVLLPCVNTLFEDNSYENRTKKTHLLVHDAHVSILAASTIETYENCWTSMFTDIGFNNRLWIVPGEANRRFSMPPEMPDDVSKPLDASLLKVRRLAVINPSLTMTEEARGYYHDWYMDMDNASAHAMRLDTYASRFMILLAASCLKPEIDLEVVQQVTEMCDWQLRVRKAHDPIDADNQVAKLEIKIRKTLETNGPLKERELKRRTHAERSGLGLFAKALKNLKSAGELALDKRRKEWGILAE